MLNDVENAASASSPVVAPRSFEHWIEPSSDKKLSFFQNTDSSSSSNRNNTKNIFILPYPIVYRFLSFLKVKDIVSGFYPTCRGFGEITQSLSYTWWYERLYDTLFPTPLRPLNMMIMNNSSSHHHPLLSKHERIQKAIRENALTRLHYAGEDFIASQKQHNTEQSPTKNKQKSSANQQLLPQIVSKLQIAQLCHFYQEKVSCSSCHFPTAKNFVVRNPKMEFLEGENLEKKIDEWSTKQAQVTAYILRGGYVTRKNTNNTNNNNHTSTTLSSDLKKRMLSVDGLLAPFTWNHLLPDEDGDDGNELDEKEESLHHQNENGTTTTITPTTTFMNTCRECKKQHAIPISSFDELNPLQTILPNVIQDVDNNTNNEDQKDDDVTSEASASSYPPLSYSDKFKDKTTQRLLSYRQVSALHEALYWALISGSVTTKNMVYTFSGEKRTCCFSRITNPVTCRSVELRSFFRYVADSFPRFNCEIKCYFHGLKKEDAFAQRRKLNRKAYSNYVPTSQNSDSDNDDVESNHSVTHINEEGIVGGRRREYYNPDQEPLSMEDEVYFMQAEEEIARGINDDDNDDNDDLGSDSDESSDTSSDDSSSSSSDDSDNASNNTKKKKKKKNKGLLQLDNDRPLEELHRRIRRQKIRQEKEKEKLIDLQKRKERHQKLQEQLDARKKRIARFPPIKNELEEKMDKDNDYCRVLFFAGHGRVELDKTPRIHIHILKMIADHLGLPHDFPMFLLWNSIVHSCGFAVDFVPFASDVRIMHRIALENMFEEAAMD